MLLNSMYIFIPHKKEKPSDGQLRRGRPGLPAAFQRKPIVFIPTQIYKKTPRTSQPSVLTQKID